MPPGGAGHCWRREWISDDSSGPDAAIATAQLAVAHWGGAEQKYNDVKMEGVGAAFTCNADGAAVDPKPAGFVHGSALEGVAGDGRGVCETNTESDDLMDLSIAARRQGIKRGPWRDGLAPRMTVQLQLALRRH